MDSERAFPLTAADWLSQFGGGINPELLEELSGTYGAEAVAQAVVQLFEEGTANLDLDRMSESIVVLGTAAVEPLLRLLRHWDSRVRCRTVEILRRIGDPRAIQPITKLLDDENQAVRDTAKWALGGRKPAAAGEGLDD